MREWPQHKAVRVLGPPNLRCAALHLRHASQKIACISRTVEGQHGHSLLQRSMPDEEDRDCVPNKRKTITWTPNAFLNSLGHEWGFSTNAGFSREKVQRDWVTFSCQHLGMPIPHLSKLQHHTCTCKRFAIDEFGDHLHTCSQHAGAKTGAHEHILTALQKKFTKAGFKTDGKQVPHNRGLKKADLWIKDFTLGGIRDVIIDVTLRHEFHGSSAHLDRNGELTHDDVNGALEAAIKEKLNHYHHDYNERNFLFLPAVMTTSGRISGDFLRLI
jgi:hypothetical protein